jgi:hypothetical protein
MVLGCHHRIGLFCIGCACIRIGIQHQGGKRELRGRCPVCEIRGHNQHGENQYSRLCGFCGEYFECKIPDETSDRERICIERHMLSIEEVEERELTEDFT